MLVRYFLIKKYIYVGLYLSDTEVCGFVTYWYRYPWLCNLLILMFMVSLLTNIEVRGFDFVRGQFQVAACFHTQGGGVHWVVGVVVIRHDVLYRLLVTDHVSREPPLCSQNVRQQTLVPTSRYSIYSTEHGYSEHTKNDYRRTFRANLA